MTAKLILVVEDEQVVAMDLEFMLRSLGYQVLTADSGETAVTLAASAQPQIVLMDIRLKGQLDGVGAAKRIGAIYDVPIVYLTAYSDEPTRNRVAETAPYGYLVKPFDEKTLISTLEMALVRHHHDRQLREREAWYHTTLQSIADAVITTDADARITYVNPVAAALLELSPAQALGRPIDEIVRILDDQAQQIEPHPLRMALERCETIAIDDDLCLRTLGEHEIWVADTIAPIRHNNEAPLGAVMIFRDAQGRRAAEQVRLLTQQHEAERQYLDRLRILAGGVAHDLNNLLTGILGYGELARHGSGNPAAVEDAVGRMEVICFRATELTRQLLAYAGRVKLSLEVLDLNRIVRDIVAELGATHLRDVTLNLRLHPQLPAFNGDAAQIHQLVLNMLVNAAEACGPAGGTIVITSDVYRAETAGDVPGGAPMIRLRVRDNGPGIEPNVQARIFEPFFSTKGLGRGLGLSSVIGTVHAHNGTITLDSTPGVGTEFTIVLPALDVLPSAQVPPHGNTVWQGHGTVLLIDDDPQVREVTRQFLRRLGFDIYSAADGDEGLALYRRHHASLAVVLLDLNMPGISGTEVAAQMRAHAPHVPIILMSGYSHDDVADLLDADPAMQFLAKPFTLQTLRTQLGRLLEGASAAPESAHPDP